MTPTDLEQSTARSNVQNYRTQFWIMCLAFGVNHATVTTPIIYASTILQTSIGNAGNAVLYASCLLSTLFLGAPVVFGLGPKSGLFWGMAFYAIYALLFAFASLTCEVPAAGGSGCTVGGTLQWTLEIIGSACAGIGAGILWTSQGAYFSAVSEAIADAEGAETATITAQLAGTFAIFFVGIETVVKAAFTLCVLLGVKSDTLLFFIYAIIAIISALAFTFSQDLRVKAPAVPKSACAQLMSAMSLWSDPRIWLLSFTNIAFGFSVAWLNGYVNANFLAEALGGKYIGFLGAGTCLVATVAAKIYSQAPGDAKGLVLCFGSSCFIGIGVLSLLTVPNGMGPGGWGLGILVFYVLQGLGRGVFESTNKAAFADAFPGEASAPAFANCMMQNTFASTVGYIWQATNTPAHSTIKPLVGVLIVTAFLTYPSYMFSKRLETSEKPSSTFRNGTYGSITSANNPK